LASTRRGFAHKIVPNGVQLWRRLCSPLGVPPDDDDDDDGGIPCRPNPSATLLVALRICSQTRCYISWYRTIAV